MRISASEAKKNADIKLNAESILDAIYYNISSASKEGKYELEISVFEKLEKFTKQMVNKIIKDKKLQDEIISSLQNMGYKVKPYDLFIKILWE